MSETPGVEHQAQTDDLELEEGGWRQLAGTIIRESEMHLPIAVGPFFGAAVAVVPPDLSPALWPTLPPSDIGHAATRALAIAFFGSAAGFLTWLGLSEVAHRYYRRHAWRAARDLPSEQLLAHVRAQRARGYTQDTMPPPENEALRTRAALVSWAYVPVPAILAAGAVLWPRLGWWCWVLAPGLGATVVAVLAANFAANFAERAFWAWRSNTQERRRQRESFAAVADLVPTYDGGSLSEGRTAPVNDEPDGKSDARAIS